MSTEDVDWLSILKSALPTLPAYLLALMYVLRGHNLGPLLGPSLADLIKKYLTPATMVCLVGGVALVALHPALRAYHPGWGSLGFVVGPILDKVLSFPKKVTVTVSTGNGRKLRKTPGRRSLNAEDPDRPSQCLPARASPPPLQLSSMAPPVPQAEQQPKEIPPPRPLSTAPGDHPRSPDTQPQPGSSGVN